MHPLKAIFAFHFHYCFGNQYWLFYCYSNQISNIIGHLENLLLDLKLV